MLELNAVHSYYGNIHALKGISLRVDEGEIVTLIGANGAGKTTTLKTISGVLRPRQGTVLFEGTRLETLAPNKIVGSRVIHVPEGRRIFGRMTVRENLEMGAFLRTDPQGIEADMNRVFELFPRLKERINQAGGTLSGGEQQMLAIGRGLMANPRLLMMDEPSMGVAPILVEQIYQTLAQINRQGTTILLVEQNAAMALSIAHRGYVLETGEIVLHDTAANLSRSDLVRKAYLGEE